MMVFHCENLSQRNDRPTGLFRASADESQATREGDARVNVTEKGHRAEVTIKNGLGLHLRPASQLVKLASRFDGCEIYVSKDGQSVNAKSIMGVIMLAADQGSQLTIEAQGVNSEQAVLALVELIESGFGES
jgi:phosphocarrier protein